MDSTGTTLATRPDTNVERLDRYRNAAETAAAAIEAGKKTNTTRAYRSDLARFGAFATGTTLPATSAANRNEIIDELVQHGENELPADPSTLAVFVGDMIEHGLAPSSIDRALSAIGKRTRELHGIRADFTHARAALKGYERARTEDGHTTGRAAPFRLADLQHVGAELDLDIAAGLRDRCALTLWYFGGLRRSELVRLRIADVTEIPGKGLEIRIRNAKTGNRTVAIPSRQDRSTDPLRAFCTWLDHLNDNSESTDDEQC